MALGRIGVWDHSSWSVFNDPDGIAELERLGYGTAWLGGSPSADLTAPEAVLSRSSTLVVRRNRRASVGDPGRAP